MKAFIRTKLGLACVVGFAALMAFMLHRISSNRRARQPSVTAAPAAASGREAGTVPATSAGALNDASRALAENATYFDQFGEFDRRVREDRDRQGNTLTRRVNPGTPAAAGRVTETAPAPAPESPALPSRGVLRLRGGAGRPTVDVPSAAEPLQTSAPGPVEPTADVRLPPRPPHPPPRRFNPYGSVIKCELVFTLDSTNEETPLIGVVMEPTYNNGQLTIPAGTELHGVARPDRLRDRIFSGPDWILVFPRESGRPNGRQLHVRGVALDRVEPDANGMTWGLTDGSYGLEGDVIRTMREEEIQRFVATFLAAAAETLEQRQTTRSLGDTIRNTPQNAVLQGLAANLSQMAQQVSDEISKHGVFIRVPAGHQFYFYPMQVIDPDAADIASTMTAAK